MTYLRRLIAMFFAVTVLPLRSLYHSLEFGIAALCVGAVSLIGAPVLAAYLFYRGGFSWPVNLLLNLFVVFPGAAVLVSLGLVVAASYLAYTTVVNTFKVAWVGLKNGFNDGMEGFWRTWNNQSSPLDLVSNHLRAYSNRVGVENQINNEDDFSELYLSIEREPMDKAELNELDPMSLLDASSKMPQAPDLQDSTNKLLSFEEEKGAEDLINECSALTLPLSSGLKEQVRLLATRTDNYKQLYKYMSQVQKALTANDLSEVEDQLIVGLEVTNPIIVMKQYQTANSRWHCVPANSYISDKENFLTWLKEKSTHPLNNDVLKKPTPYEGNPARYRWGLLTTNNCFLVQELHEGASIVRDLLSTLPAQLNAAKENTSSPGSSSHALFGRGLSQKNQEQPVGDQVVEFNLFNQRGLV
ncbi:hypothetical protein TUM19329_05790 [Legionella antarctica]|uniref:Coiled coil protein n=1 Tax=Legionella antarctica TaxID=2708020 RepID=A0A6F8T1F3_9GAMM|nr:MnhB domain-containing protein [Legionella antarctica]BCA94218.1 hypothetical protein TUM19329_05790 [Legionella antarctica]